MAFKYSCALLLVLCAVLVSTSPSNTTVSSTVDDSCPTWTHHVDGSTDCECGDSVFGAVHCNQDTKEVSVNTFYCMSLFREQNKTVVGCCPYTNKAKNFAKDNILYSVPNDTSQLDDAVCGHLNRTGLMCGSCRDGHAPPVYSYSLACVECSDYKYNWLKYIAAAYLPLTFFYFIVILFRINISSPSMSVYVLISQLVGIPPVMQLLSHMEDGGRGFATSAIQHRLTRVWQIAVTGVYGLWNLDFFRVAYKPFCMRPSMTTLPVFALDYAIAVYPIFLTILTYILVQLHYRYSLVVRLWKPFGKCFYYFRKEWDLSNSLIGAFGTFFLLSYMKILYTSFALMVPTTLHDMSGEVHLSLRYLLYDGTVQWFGGHHAGYAFLALFMFFAFNFLPLLLLFLYPYSCFQRFLNRFGLSSQFLHTLMDTIHGGYKLEPRDCRYFAVLYLLVRIVNLTIFSSILYIYDYFLAVGSVLLLCTFIVAIVRPYKKTIHNILDTIMLLVLGYTTILYSYLTTVGEAKVESYASIFMKTFTFIFGVGIAIPPLYGLGLFLYAVVPRKVVRKMKSLVKRLKREENETDDEPLHQYLDENSPLLRANKNKTKNIQSELC